MWHVLWYVSYSPNERDFLSASFLLLRTISASYPANFQPLHTERLILSMAAAFVHQRKPLSLRVLKSLTAIVPATKEFAERLAGFVGQA